jgi:CheY-like chemotaxis protein
METKIRMLIADDNIVGRDELGKMFKRMGFDVILALNGKDAVTICDNDPMIEVVLMDGEMPIMNGNTATRLIKKSRPNLIIIAVTGNDDIEKTYQEVGYDSYVEKPVFFDKFTSLLALITTMLRKE